MNCDIKGTGSDFTVIAPETVYYMIKSDSIQLVENTGFICLFSEKELAEKEIEYREAFRVISAAEKTVISVKKAALLRMFGKKMEIALDVPLGNNIMSSLFVTVSDLPD